MKKKKAVFEIGKIYYSFDTQDGKNNVIYFVVEDRTTKKMTLRQITQNGITYPDVMKTCYISSHEKTETAVGRYLGSNTYYQFDATDTYTFQTNKQGKAAVFEVGLTYSYEIASSSSTNLLPQLIKVIKRSKNYVWFEPLIRINPNNIKMKTYRIQVRFDYVNNSEFFILYVMAE